MYRVYYLNKAFFLCDKAINNIETVNISDVNDLCFTLRNWLEEEEDRDLCITGMSPEKMLEALKGIYHYMEAAGGVVKNKKGFYLFIKRFGKWDLPKGKIEKGESPEQAALREVMEETGIEQLEIERPLNSSFHIYPWKNNYVLKKTFWYLMNTVYDGPLKPQTEEAISEALWLPASKAKEALQTSYRSLKENLLEFL